jgi:general L-amino acid transport system permease protein
LPIAWPVSFLIILWFIKGGLGLEETSTNVWNGLLLTLLAAVISITLSFPIGVLLALGRQSTLPVIRWLSILYIEVVRGLPLIGILFFALTMLQFFLPPEFPNLDRVYERSQDLPCLVPLTLQRMFVVVYKPCRADNPKPHALWD